MNKAVSLEQRIQNLQDIESIKNIQATYGHYCDKGGWNDKPMNNGEVALLFTEDAIWECPLANISVKGREEIRKMFEAMDAGNSFLLHSFSNPIIEIDGDKAKAKWLLFLGGKTDDKTNLTYGSYENEYARTSRGWLIKAIRLNVAERITAHE